MVDTNALLSIGFALISNFVNTVNLPEAMVPASTKDVQRYHLGFRYAPLDTYIVLNNGDEFWIQNGVVQGFASSGSYFRNHRDAHPPNTLLKSSLTSNQVIELATRTVERLTKNRNPTTRLVPKVQTSPGSDGSQAAFYNILWPTRGTQSSFGYSAALEIDARRGTLTFLDLRDDGFFDYSFAREVSNRVYTPDPPLKLKPKRAPVRPTAKQVEDGIASWLEFCARLGFDPGVETNLAFVNWDRTDVYTNHMRSATVPVCHVRFANGAGFESLGGSVFSIVARDPCFAGDWGNKPKEHWAKFHGKLLKRWQDLAKELEAALVNRVGLPKDILASLTPRSVVQEGEIGTEGLKRILVQWEYGSGEQTQKPREFLFAEFDVESGELKLLTFWDRTICDALRQALSRPRPK